MLTIPYSPGEDNLFIPGHTNLDTVINRFTIFFFARSLSFALSFSASLSRAPDTAATACHLSPRSAGRFIYLFSFFFRRSSFLSALLCCYYYLLFILWRGLLHINVTCAPRLLSFPTRMPGPESCRFIIIIYFFVRAYACARWFPCVKPTRQLTFARPQPVAAASHCVHSALFYHERLINAVSSTDKTRIIVRAKTNTFDECFLAFRCPYIIFIVSGIWF